MAGIRTCDRESQVQRPNHYTTEPPAVVVVVVAVTYIYFTISKQNLTNKWVSQSQVARRANAHHAGHL